MDVCLTASSITFKKKYNIEMFWTTEDFMKDFLNICSVGQYLADVGGESLFYQVTSQKRLVKT